MVRHRDRSLPSRGRETECGHGHDIAGLIDVPGQVGSIEDPERNAEPFGFVPVSGERPRAVGEPEPGVSGDDDDIGSVAVAVGNQRDPRIVPDQGQIRGPGEIGVSHGDLGHPVGHEVFDAGLHRTVEPASRFPHHQRTAVTGPAGDLCVVAHHGDGERVGGTDDTVGHGPGQRRALRCAEGHVQATLGLSEGLDRNQHSPGPDGERIARWR